MLHTLGIVQIPSSRRSSHARALLARCLGGKPLLDWVVRRVTDSLRLDGVIAVANSELDRDALLRVVPADVPVFAFGEDDALSATAAALRKIPAQAVVLVSLEAPFVDPVLIDRLVTTAEATPTCDYIGYSSSNSPPAAPSRLGLFAEWVRAEALLRAHRKASHRPDRQNITRFILSRPDLFQLQFMPVPAPLNRHDLRLTLGVNEDWDHAESIYEALGPDGLEWQRIARLLDDQPALRERMAVLNQAEAVA